VQFLLSTAVIILLLSITLSALSLTSFGSLGLDKAGWRVGGAMVLIFWCYMVRSGNASPEELE